MDRLTEELTYTYTEVQKNLCLLSEADTARIIQSYRVMGCESRTGMSAHDVLSEVVCKLLTMERLWPVEVASVPYFVETGRSIISNEEKKYSREVATDFDVTEGKENNPHTSGPWLDTSVPSAEARLVEQQKGASLQQWIGNISDLFLDDQDAMCFISQKLAEVKKSAILLICNLTDQAYRNVEKRIKDKVRKKFPHGFPWWELPR